jgi:hypothetical protein
MATLLISTLLLQVSSCEEATVQLSPPLGEVTVIKGSCAWTIEENSAPGSGVAIIKANIINRVIRNVFISIYLSLTKLSCFLRNP